METKEYNTEKVYISLLSPHRNFLLSGGQCDGVQPDNELKVLVASWKIHHRNFLSKREFTFRFHRDATLNPPISGPTASEAYLEVVRSSDQLAD